jgi:hypothetical protein
MFPCVTPGTLREVVLFVLNSPSVFVHLFSDPVSFRPDRYYKLPVSVSCPGEAGGISELARFGPTSLNRSIVLVTSAKMVC